MNVKAAFIAGLIIFVGWILSSMITGFIVAFLPLSGLIGTVVSFLLFSLVLGFIVVALLARFR